jgi:hypothetical protein
MPAAIRTTISAANKVTFSHYPVTIFHIKVLPFLQVIGKTVAFAKNIIKIAHEKMFLQN